MALAFPIEGRAQYQYEPQDGGVTITGYSGSGCDVIIPSMIDGLKVIRIADQVFQDRSDLRSVRISDGITSIGWGAFAGCINLTNIILPESLTNVGDYAFGDCTNLKGLNSLLKYWVN